MSEGLRAPRLFLLAWLRFFFQFLLVSGQTYGHDSEVCSRNAEDAASPLRWEHGTCIVAGEWHPWSGPPFCPEPEQDDDDAASADCVFTSLTFRGSQGISLITTPELAASVAGALQNSRASPRGRYYLPGHTGSGQDRRDRQERTAPYEIRELPGRGKGLVAKRRFAKHETIMVGFPVLVVRLDFLNGDRHAQRQKRAMMEAAVKRLHPEQRKSVMALARSTGGEPILDALRTNGFGIEIGNVQHLALFVDGSRVNHNCRPNAFWRYVNSNMAMEIVALRDIGVGEEISHSYAPLGRTYEERRAILQSWGFLCRCALCSSSAADRHLSDTRRERLLEVYQILGQASELSHQRIGELVREAESLIELEELEPQLVEYYQQFARAYLMVKDLETARHYVSKADTLWLLYGGEEHENIQGIRELWQALEEAEGHDVEE